MKIEATEEVHLKELFAIHERCFKDHIEEIWGWDETWQWNYFLKEWKDSEWRILLKDDKIIGYLVWIVDTDHLYVKNIAFIPEYRKQGLGRQAMHYIDLQAKVKNLPIKLSTFRTNHGVVSFYEKLGFKVTEVVETGVKMTKDNQADDE